MKIEIHSMEELHEFLNLFAAANQAASYRTTVEPADSTITDLLREGEAKRRKARAKPAAEPVEEPQPEPIVEAAPEPDQEAAPEPEQPKAEEKPKGKPKKVTRDDVVQAFRGYIDRFGQKAAMTDVTVLLKRGFDVSMIKEIPDGEDNYKKAIKIVTEAININEFNREAVQ